MLTWLEISKQSLLLNNRTLRKAVGRNVKLLTVVKSNAYGHGIIEVAGILKKYTEYFGVAGLEEALLLRSKGITNPILVLSFFDKDRKKIARAIKESITFPAYSTEQVQILNDVASRLRKTAKIHIKADTGTSRVGQRPEKLEKFISNLNKYSGVRVAGLYSHFADSEENRDYTKKQLSSFEQARTFILKYYPNAICHIACSAATVLHQKTHYNLVRAGIMAYGLYPSKKTEQKPKHNDYLGKNYKLQPALSWKTRIIQVKELPKNTYVGYGLSFRTARKTKMAVLPVGYADGYPRRLSNSGVVLVAGKKARVIGRVCMNLTMIDVSGIPASEGDEVVLLGKQGGTEVTAEMLASKVGTINYEIVTRINWALPRVVVK